MDLILNLTDLRNLESAYVDKVRQTKVALLKSGLEIQH